MLVQLLSAALLQLDQAGIDASAARPAEPRKQLVLTALPRCLERQETGEVVVCGRNPDRYRLPLPRERGSASSQERSDQGTGAAALTPAGRCGIFAGERRCGKREAADYGYGNGRDPITVMTRLAEKIADPDAD